MGALSLPCAGGRLQCCSYNSKMVCHCTLRSTCSCCANGWALSNPIVVVPAWQMEECLAWVASSPVVARVAVESLMDDGSLLIFQFGLFLIDGTAPAIPQGEKHRPDHQLKGLSLVRDGGECVEEDSTSWAMRFG